MSIYRVFIGSSAESRVYAQAVADIVDGHTLFRAIPWWSAGVFTAGSSFFESLVRAARTVTFALFVGTPDDILLSRSSRQPVVRDNVLFEYGLFAGRLGAKRVALVQVGRSRLPSDLDGITQCRLTKPTARSRNSAVELFRPDVVRCLEGFLDPEGDHLELAANELRESSHLDIEQFLALQSAAVKRRLSTLGVATLRLSDLRELLRRCTIAERKVVGLPEHPTAVADFVDLDSLDEKDLLRLAYVFANFVGEQLLPEQDGFACRTRVAIHLKQQLRFLARVVERLNLYPVLVTPEELPPRPKLRGRFVPGDRAVLVHDFTESGFTPLRCIEELRASGIGVDRLVTFRVRERALDGLRELCEQRGIQLRVFCVQRDNGELELTSA